MPFVPDRQSSAYEVMAPYWRMIEDILGGAPAIRKAGEKYLPRFEKEPEENYRRRVEVAPWTPLYAASVRQLAAKPFEREVQVNADPIPPGVKALVENIDGGGNHLSVFASDVFYAGINAGVDWIFVDYPRMRPGATLADERAMGARVFWYRIPALRMLAVYEAFTGAGTETVHARIDESTVETDENGAEVVIARVRVIWRAEVPPTEQEQSQGITATGRYGAPQWALYEQRLADQGKSTAWEVVDEGVFTIPQIPLAPFVTARRTDGSWLIRPPMRDLAYMQISEYQMASNLAEVQTMTAYPMLKARGVGAPDSGWVRGPRVVLEAPMADGGHMGDFAYIEPAGSSAASLREDLERIRREMREEGMQPLLPESGGVTATATAVAESKAQSAVQAWALKLKDAIEQAFVFTAMWMDDQAYSVEVGVHIDFAVGAGSLESMTHVRQMYEDDVISREAYVAEAKRRNILMPEYDADDDLAVMAEEDDGEDDPGFTVVPPPQPQAGEPPEPQSGTDDET